MQKRYRVALHAHVTAVVFVEAANAQEANRLAKEEVKAGRAKVSAFKAANWTPVRTTDMNGPRA